MQCTFEKNELAFVARLMYLGNLIVNGDRPPHAECAQSAALASKACAAYAEAEGLDEESARERIFSETLPLVEEYERSALPASAAKVAAEGFGGAERRLAAQALFEEALERDPAALSVQVDDLAQKLRLLLD